MTSSNPYLLIAGDLVPTKKNEKAFIEGNIDKIFNLDVKKIWSESQFRIFNLETPLSNNNNYLEKAGEFLGANPDTISGIKAMNPNLICLANNHILDLEEKGAIDTINLLSENSLEYIGVGSNIYKMKDHYIYCFNNKKICIYNCCEHEFTYATSKKFGTNPFNPLNSLFRIQELKRNCDYLIVIYHGGKELYQYCTPKLHEICHSIVKAGADLVICQHSHCISCYEKFENSTIVYGQGNFIFDLDEDDEWNKLTSEGMFVKIDLKDFSIEFIKFIKEESGKIKLTPLESLNDFYLRSKEIMNEDFIEEKYLKKISHSSYHYFRPILSTKYLGFIDNKFLSAYFIKKRYKKLRLLLINYLECEVHIENILTHLKYIKELDKN